MAFPRNQSLGRVVYCLGCPPASVDATIVAFHAQRSGSRAASAQPPSQRRRVPSTDDGALRDVKGHEGAGKASTRAVDKHSGPCEGSGEEELDTLLGRAQHRAEERVEEREREKPPALALLSCTPRPRPPRPTWFPPHVERINHLLSRAFFSFSRTRPRTRPTVPTLVGPHAPT